MVEFWYDNLGTTLVPLLSDLGTRLDASPLALWILRQDGRHFLEESPPRDFYEVQGGIGSGEAGDREPLFDPVDVVGPNEVPLRALFLEALWPGEVGPAVTSPRTIPEDTELHAHAESGEPTVKRIRFPLDSPAIPKVFLDRNGWVCRLETPGQVIGLVGTTQDKPPAFPDCFAKVWKEVSRDWIELQLEASLARREEIFRAIQAIENTITSQLDVHDILQAVVEQATVLMKAKIASLMLLDEKANQLVLESVYGSSPDYLKKPDLDVDRSLLGRVVKTARPLMVRDVRTCPQYSHRNLAKSEGLVSLLSVPLRWHETSMGVLNVYSARRYKYNRDNVYLLSMLASQSAIAIQNARTVRKTKFLENQIHEMDKLSLVGELAAGVAHEIRNPLAAVGMLVDSWTPADEGQAQDLDVISTQLQGINRCVTQLLEMAKPGLPEISPVDMAQEITNTLQTLRVRIRDQEIEVRTQFPEDLPWIHADASRFRQLLMNLLLNSLNAMPRSGVIALKAERSNHESFQNLPGKAIVNRDVSRESEGVHDTQHVLLTLSDTGGGIEVRDVREMFEPFHTSSTRGFGLGLSVVKRLAEEHHSPLKIHNTLGEGITYYILFQID